MSTTFKSERLSRGRELDARQKCAERSAALEQPPPENGLAYLNRPSDLLFALARLAHQQSGHADRMLGD